MEKYLQMKQTNLPDLKWLVSELVPSITKKTTITLRGNAHLTLSDIAALDSKTTQIQIHPTAEVQKRINKIRKAMLSQVEQGVPIYGVSSAYGGQAGRVLNKGAKQQRYTQAKKMSQAIVHVDVSTGPSIPTRIVRAAMLIRINMLLPGYSAIRLEVLNALASLLNHRLTPVVGFFGTLGASGDLAHNGRVLSTLLHDPSAMVEKPSGELAPANLALTEENIEKIALEPKEGLALVNGDNFSSAAASVQVIETTQLMLINLLTSALMIQALKGSNRNFHPLLSAVRPHRGQTFVAQSLLNLLKQSRLVVDELKGPKKRKKDAIIQDGYSIRCLPQYLGPDWETVEAVWNTVNVNINGVSDNPLWTTPETVTRNEKAYQWVSGGNFLAMYMADSLDKIRKVLVHIVKQNDRHLSRLINPHQNNNLPANISDPSSISQCTFKGLQTQMGMYDVYATILAAPVSTAFGVHEELNQDLTSHAMTSALMNQEVLKLTRYSLASNLIAACQAIELRGGPQLLSPATRPAFEWIRNRVPYITTEQPLGHFIEKVAQELTDPKLLLPIIKKTK